MERLVKESIDFKRGISSKSALGLGKIVEFRKFLMNYINDENTIDYFEMGKYDSSPISIYIHSIQGDKVNVYYENPNPIKNSKDYWIKDYFLLSDIDEIDEYLDNPSIFLKNPLPSSMDESIDFKRGISSKEALDIGKIRNIKLINKLVKDREDIRLFGYYRGWNINSHIWADLKHNYPGSISFYTDDLADRHSFANKILKGFRRDNIDRIEEVHGTYNVYLIEPEE